MKILISSHAFAPSIGGIETVSELLAKEFVRLGHAVTVVTQTPYEREDNGSFPIVRQPSLTELFRLTKWGDIYWQNNLSLRTLWPAFILRKAIVITHQGSYARRPTGFDLTQRLKLVVARRVTGVAISHAVAPFFNARCTIIPNPYNAHLFTNSPREGAAELLFLGRLVSEKGLDILLESLGHLRAQQLSPRLTIVGSGPEETALRQKVVRLGLHAQVAFLGAKTGVELAEILRQHKVLVIPSRYEEPFGVVALEGIASGCVAVGSSGGGLPEAIGPCGVTFPNGDAPGLTKILTRLLREPNECQRLRANASRHLARFHPSVIAKAYLNLFESKLR